MPTTTVYRSGVAAPSEGAADTEDSVSSPAPQSDVFRLSGAATSINTARVSNLCPGEKTPRQRLPRVPRTPEMVVRVRHCPTARMPIDICYQCFGKPEDGLPAVLLIGGLNMQMTAWDEVFCESLVHAGFYVIRYDNRDIGHSTKVENCGTIKVPMLLLPGRAAKWLGEDLPYQLEDMAADAWALLDALHIPSAHLFGISMGGMIAQRAALQAPERTMSLTSLMSSTNAPDLPQPELWVKLWMMRRPPRNCTVEELLEFRVDSLCHLLRYTLPPDGAYLKKRFLMSLRRSSYAAGLLRQAAAIRRASGRDVLLQRLHVPALVVHGAQDIVVPPMHGYRTATMLPYARMLVLKSMGHYLHPAFFSTIIAAFADMAASTDPAKRRLVSALPSVSSTQLLPTNSYDDHGGCAGGKCEAPSELGAGDLEAELSDKPGDSVDPTTLMMASLGEYIVPVVADAESPIGKAVCRSVMVAVPGGNSSPAVPEAVIVENLFQRDPHATPSVPTPSIVKRPVRSSSGPPIKQTTARPVSHDHRMIIPPLVDTEKNAVPPPPNDRPSSPATEVQMKPSSCAEKLCSLTPPLLTPSVPVGMDGGAMPFVLCSPSCWHLLSPFPRRNSPAASAGMADVSGNGGPLIEKAVSGYSASLLPSPSGAAVGTETLGRCSSKEGNDSTGLPSHERLPSFHPVVVGVAVEEYLRTHQKAGKSSAVVPATVAGSAGMSETQSVGKAAAADKASIDARPPTSAANAIVTPLDATLASSRTVHVAAITGGVDKRSTSAHDATAPPSTSLCVQTEERLTDEAFLHSEAPPNVVDASRFAAL
ncbi:hypothetical protein JKF63_05495 [Porcisia hertigi]|uniref:AB hydrolase-1 domain-containing protein n=1 Tax=Porcisia hertigi TaxID=2761500 RepID=A0A836IF11_9TRYP|nr:hypothetical protein JKF63_05495 [Porcisia hertigi]